MKKWLLFLCIVFSAEAFGQTVADYKKQAKAAEEKDDYKTAVQLYTKAIKLDDIDESLYIKRASAYIRLGDAQAAFDDFNYAVYLAPRKADPYNARATFYLLVDRNDEAIEDYTTAIKYEKTDSILLSLYNDRGTAKVKKRDFAAAYQDFTYVLSKDSNHLSTLTNIGALLEEYIPHEEAVKYLERAYRLDSANIFVLNNLGYRYIRMEKFKDALPVFNKAISIDKNMAYTYNNRGFVKYKLNDLEGALKDINQSIAMDDYNSYAYKNRALVYIAQGKTPKACKDLEKAKELKFTERYGSEVNDLHRKHCR